jgi:hypothetical protein
MHWRLHRLLVLAAICWFVPASARPVCVEARTHASSACPYERAREAAAGAAMSGAAFSLTELSRSAGALAP